MEFNKLASRGCLLVTEGNCARVACFNASFDEGLPPPPAKWKGKCDFNWTSCNNKIIGARNFDSGAEAVPPIGEEGHCTHTASTAAGNFVPNADALGNANGTAVGMAPLAHLAIYKAHSMDLYQNEAPWILTVGASTIDRKIMATATLGNGEEFDGESLFQPSDFPSTLLPLVYAGANGNASSAICAPESLKDVDVAGKVVVCDRGGGIGRIAKGQEVKDAGGAAMILTNDELNGFSTLVDAHVLPATHVSYAAGLKIKSYIKSESAPTATIVFQRNHHRSPYGSRSYFIFFERTKLGKPWHINVVPPSQRHCGFDQSAHPDWSPAAIKSAIITTADLHNLENKPIIDETFQPADLFATGAGHVNPSAANDPGLIYDLEPDDYIPYLCGLGYTDEEVGLIVNRTLKCSEESAIPEAQLNYPSFSIALGPSSRTYSRTVTNVGAANSTYSVQILAPSGVEVSVNPDKLEFTEVNQKITYMVSFSRTSAGGEGGKPFAQGFLKWVSDSQSVRSPISVMFE
ncbi:Subtilisin-like protease SBT1.7 [Vitis vinifera]|uniref:Subtilisin-like protease SBT1.7 n=1 Tax=Vitis vinifera TaxID=29760 RepID=A0A438JJD0_VITVI|nr:Subtilisin-like protease SBT1.7 [Vitis vinifera]